MLKRPSIFGFVLSIAFISALGAQAEEDTFEWKDVNGWRIAVDTTVGNGCFMSTIFDGGTVLRFGFLKNPNGAYISVGNANWTSLEPGKSYNVSIQMDNETAWNSNATATKIGLPTLVARTDKSDFVAELATKHTLRVSFNGRQVVKLSLKGSYAAVLAVIECQGKVNQAMATGEAHGTTDDPFRETEGTMNAADPFAQ